MIPSCMCFSPARVRIGGLAKTEIEREVEIHFLAQLLPDSILFVSFDDKMMIVKIFDDEAFFFIHH